MNVQEAKEIMEKVFLEIAPEIEFGKIDTSRPLRDQVEMDSFDFYRILVKIDQKTGVFIPDAKLSEFANLDQLLKFISEQPSRHQPQSTAP